MRKRIAVILWDASGTTQDSTHPGSEQHITESAHCGLAGHATDPKKPTHRPVFLRAQQPLFDGL
jgi:hypothetical protein